MQKPLFKIRCSAIGKLMTGTVGLTDIQEKRMLELMDRREGYKREFNSKERLAIIEENKAIQKRNDDIDLAISQGEKLSRTEAKKGKLKKYKFQNNDLTENMLNELAELRYKAEFLELPQTAKSYIESWLKGILYDKRSTYSSIYTDKGNIMEDLSIEYMVKVHDLGFAKKNKVRKSNEWCEGECDVELLNEIRDMKNSFSEETFPLFQKEIDKDYWYQLLGYCWLWNKPKAMLVYTLMNCPEEVLFRMAKSAMYDLKNEGKLFDEVYEKLEKRYSFEHLPDHLRIKWWDVEYDKDVIEDIKFRVLLARDYVDELWQDVENQKQRLLEINSNVKVAD